MAAKHQRPRGTEDVFFPRSSVFRQIENTFVSVLEAHGFTEMRVPIFERAEVFQRSVGEYTDIVSKEMYVFEDRGGRTLALRPEGTAGMVRAFIENGLAAQGGVQKYYYTGPMFRYERPQAGRLRQHTQFGGEVFGDSEPSADAELISMLLLVAYRLGLKNVQVLVNSVGCSDCREPHRALLVDFLGSIAGRLCEDCNTRKERNPLRVFDCKNERCQKALEKAPRISDHLCEACLSHHQRLMRFLEILEAPFTSDPKLVRGFDYYTRTVFEIKCEGLGAKDTVFGGGRYDNLVREFGGPDLPALGFGCGIERLYLTLEAQGVAGGETPKVDLYLAPMGDAAFDRMIALARQLRARGFRVELLHASKGMKAHFKLANRCGARYTLVCGENEIQHGVYAVKRMEDGTQIDIPAENVEKWSSPADIEGVFR